MQFSVNLQNFTTFLVIFWYFHHFRVTLFICFASSFLRHSFFQKWIFYLKITLRAGCHVYTMCASLLTRAGILIGLPPRNIDPDLSARSPSMTTNLWHDGCRTESFCSDRLPSPQAKHCLFCGGTAWGRLSLLAKAKPRQLFAMVCSDASKW